MLTIGNGEGEGREDEARERRGCAARFALPAAILLLLLMIGVVGFLFWTGTANFADYVRRKIEVNLETKTGREVTIGRVEIDRGRISTVTLYDVRMAGSPEGEAEYLTHIDRVVIRGGIESFLSRHVRVGTVDVYSPKFWIEVLPGEAEATTNFPGWKRAEPRRFQIYRLDVDLLRVHDGSVFFHDMRRNLRADVGQLAAVVHPSLSDQIYRGTLRSQQAVIRLPNAEPVAGQLGGQFLYEPGRLQLDQIRLAGRGLDVSLSGAIDPLQEGVFRFDLDSQVALARVREVFGLDAAMEGVVTLDATLAGSPEGFRLSGGVVAPSITAQEYDLTDLRGTVDWTKDRLLFDIARAGYGGGTVSGQYRLLEFTDPLPMEVDLDFDKVSLEKLFEDWTLEGTGLRGAITGSLAYAWNGSEVLEGSGTADARLAPGAVAFGNAPYPMPVRGRVGLAFDDGVIRFQRAALSTPSTDINISGTLAFDELRSDLNITAQSRDLRELDRLAVNFARAAENDEFDLLGFAGSGRITARVRGPLGSPVVDAQLAGSNLHYNDQLLGDGSIGISWNGPREVLTLRDGRFVEDGQVAEIAGTIAFPEGGGPRFDLRIGAAGLPVQRALEIAGLEFDLPGVATGELTVEGTPEAGTVTFDPVTVAVDDGTAVLDGTVSWRPGEGNLGFDLGVLASNFPLEEALSVAELDLGLEGRATGALRIEGRSAEGTVYFDSLRVVQGDAVAVLNGSLGWAPGEGNLTFDLAIDATNYPVEDALELANLDFELGGLANGRLRVVGRSSEGTVFFEPLRVTEGASTIDLDGSIAWAPGEGNLTFDLGLDASNVAVARIARFLGVQDLPASGLIDAKVRLQGPQETLSGAGTVRLREGQIAGEQIESAVADVVLTAGVAELRNVEITAPAGTVRGYGRYNIATGSFDYVIEQADIQLAELEILGELGRRIGGRLVLNSSGVGTLAQPEIVLEARLEDPVFRGMNVPEGAEDPRLLVMVREGIITIRGGAWNLIDITGSGTVSPEGSVDGDVVVTVADLGQLLGIVAPGADVRADGEFVLAADLGGNISSLETLEASIVASDVQLQLAGRSVRPAEPIRLTLDEGRLTVDSFRLRTDDAELALTGSVSLTGDRPLDLEVRGRFDAAIAQLFAPELRPRGWIDVAVAIDGTLSQPVVTGTGEVRNADVRIPGINQLLSNINATVLFQGEELRIDSFRARLGGGEVVAGGTMGIGPTGPTQFRVFAQGEDVSLRLAEGLSTSGNFDLLLSGDPERALLQGSVIVDRATYTRDFDLTNLILNRILEPGAGVPDFAASWQDRVDLRVDVQALDAIAIRNNIADIEGTGELSIRGTLAQPVILGRVEVAEGGTFELQDVEYNIVSGTINFQNPFRNDPYLDITAEGRIREYDLTINLTGTLDRINTTITSDPPAGDLTLLSLFTADVGPGAASARDLGLTGQSLLLQSVGGLIGSRIFPFVDSFRIDATSFESSDPTVTFEKQISADVRVVVSYNVGNGRNVEIVEWQVSPDWVLLLTSENEGGGSSEVSAVESALAVDARFRRRYDGHFWSRRDREIARAAAAVSDDGVEPFARERIVTVGESLDAEAPVPRMVTGPLVRQVRAVADTAFDTSRIDGLITVETNAPLSSRDVRNSIRALFATGEFRDIRVETVDATGGGVEVIFRLSINYRFGEVRMDGADAGDFARDLRIRTGDVVSLDAVDRSAVAIQERLQRRGFMEATVDPEVQFDRDANRADVIFDVTRGQQATIGEIRFEGDTAPLTEARLREAMRVRPGQGYRLARARDQIERIRQAFVREGYRRADVQLEDTEYSEETGTIDLVYAVDPGIPVEVEVIGVDRRTVRRWLPFRSRNEAYTADAVADAAERIERELQRRGYFYASVQLDEIERDGRWIVQYEVQPGERYSLAGVEFEGNESFTDKRLEELVSTGRPGFIQRAVAAILRRDLGVTQEQLTEDREALETFYRLEGFSRASVDRPVARTTDGDRLTVVFPLVEGPRTIVGDVTVDGTESISVEQLPSLGVQRGEPLNPLLVSNDVIVLRGFYADRGYVEANVVPDVTYAEDLTSAEVTYRITEGPEVRVGQVVIRGNDFTTTSTIERTANLETGEPFTFNELLSAQRNLQRLGIFQRVELLPDRAGTDPTVRNVAIEVEEGRNLTFAGALGYSTEDGARATVSASHRNLFGTGRYLGLEARISERQENYFINYRSPFLFRYPYPTQISFFKVDEERIDLETQKLGTFIEVSRVYRESLRASFRYDYRRVECVAGRLCDLASGGVPDPNIPLEDRPIEISSFGPSVVLDRRDDPLNPRDGYFAAGSLEYAFPLLAAETEFIKGFISGSWYFPFSERSLVALNGRAGGISPLGGSDIPFAERFFGGGAGTHRGFPLDLLGNVRPCPLEQPGCGSGVIVPSEEDELASLGGQGMTLLSAEYRFPIFGSLGGAVFFDAGNVWADADRVDFGDLRYAAGLGVRYLTPVGPLRLDVGFNLDPQSTVNTDGTVIEEQPYVIFFTLGYPY